MQASICSRCGKNPAVVFITKIEGNQTKSEGLCLKCARELHIKPVDDILTKMGISDEDLDNLSGEMMNAMSGVEELMGMDPEETSETDEDGKTATFPFFGKLLDAFRPNSGASGANQNPADGEAGKRPGPGQQIPRSNPAPNAKNGKRKYLDNYCIDLTARARAGELDAMVGRDEELERVIQILNRRQKNNPCLIGTAGRRTIPA